MENTKKLIALDLDGTLLNWRKTIKQETIDALVKAQEQGHVVMIATGRPYVSSLRYAKMIHIDKFNGFISNYNGGLITRLNPEEKIYDVKMDMDLLKRIINFMNDMKADYSVLHEKKLYTNKYSRLIFKIYRKLVGQVAIDNEELHDYTDFPVYKVLVNDWKRHLKVTKFKLEKEFGDEVDINFSSRVSIEITPKETSKGKSVLRVARILGIDPMDTIAFGNYGNDISMLKMCGTGVAMKNSSSELLDVADYVTDTNNRNGIAKYLKKFILK